MHRYNAARASLGDLEGLLSRNHLKLYVSRGVAWDESGRTLAGGKPVWWAKLVPDGQEAHYVTGTGRTMKAAVDAAMAKFHAR
jgi:hypothetical protein